MSEQAIGDKTLTTKYTAIVAVIATLAGLTCKADEVQFQLSGKSLTVYPIVLARPDTVIDEKTRKFGERITEVVGLTLEQHGMLPAVSAEYPETISPDDALAEVARKFQTFVEGEAIETDYPTFLEEGVDAPQSPCYFLRSIFTEIEMSGRGSAW